MLSGLMLMWKVLLLLCCVDVPVLEVVEVVEVACKTGVAGGAGSRQ